ncbi:MAG: ABC transporter permease [Chloroflexi bacterium]|nr:ABC transporter permease [Chloroflexota bacterium]
MSLTDVAASPVLAGAASERLAHRKASRGFWSDALARLLENRVATASLVFIGLLLLVAIFAPSVAPYPYDEQHMSQTWQAPSAQYWLGTDAFGRDILSRLIFGARVSLTVAIMAQVIILLLGVPLGLVSGLLGGRVDNAIMRLVDALYALPSLLIVIVFMTLMKQVLAQRDLGLLAPLGWLDRGTGGLTGVFIGIGLTYWLTVCRLVRAQTLSLREREFVIAARAVGAGNRRIIWRHLAPNCLAPVIVAASLGVPTAIMLEAGLSFIGLGISPPMPSWGTMVADGVEAIRGHPHAVIAPCAAISLTLLAFNFLGDGLRDALDPLLKS